MRGAGGWLLVGLGMVGGVVVVLIPGYQPVLALVAGVALGLGAAFLVLGGD